MLLPPLFSTNANHWLYIVPLQAEAIAFLSQIPFY
jgi:hypothetical protein